MSCNDEDRATRSLPIFSKYAKRNSDGWGVGWFEGNNAIVRRAPCRADWDEAFYDSIDEARSHNLIAHIRYATHGEANDCNCHPFIRHHNGRDWMMAHNGVVPVTSTHPNAEGATDSETIFHEIMDKVREYQNSGNFRGKYQALKKAIRNVLESYGASINLNLLISDGNMLYAFNHHSSKTMYMLRRSKSYGGAILISTQKLTDENWEVIPKDRLLCINNGEIEILSSPLVF